MSATPTFSLKLIKDFDFKQKFNLTHTQTDVMAYFVNLSNWAFTCGSGYYLALTSKIMNDLGLGLKTVEASILILKKLNLITVKQTEVEEWCSFIQHRYVALTAKGRTYDNSYFPPKESKRLDDLEDNNRELREKIKTMELAVITEKERLAELKEAEENSQNSSKESSKKDVKVEPIKGKRSTSEFEDIIGLKAFIIKSYKKSQKPICNNVKGWLPKTEFYINNYGNLSVLTPEKDFKQVDSIADSNHFWEWLCEYQKLIGVIKKNVEILNISSLLKFVGEKIKLNDGVMCIVKEIIAKKGGVSLYFTHPDKGTIHLISNRISKLYTVEESLKIFNNGVILT